MTSATRPSLAELIALGQQAEGGSSPAHADQAVSEAASLIATAVGQMTLRVERATGSLDMSGWFSPAGAVLASDNGETGVRLALLTCEQLTPRVARLVGLGPRPDSDQELQLVVPAAALVAMLEGTLSGDTETAARALGIPADQELSWAAQALSAPDLTRWTLVVEGAGEQAAVMPRSEIDVIDSPASSLWLRLSETADSEIILASTTPRALWIALATVLPCWDRPSAES